MPRWIVHHGRRMTLSDWARETGLAANTIADRLRRGVPVERALERAPLSRAAAGRRGARRSPWRKG